MRTVCSPDLEIPLPGSNQPLVTGSWTVRSFRLTLNGGIGELCNGGVWTMEHISWGWWYCVNGFAETELRDTHRSVIPVDMTLSMEVGSTVCFAGILMMMYPCPSRIGTFQGISLVCQKGPVVDTVRFALLERYTSVKTIVQWGWAKCKKCPDYRRANHL